MTIRQQVLVGRWAAWAPTATLALLLVLRQVRWTPLSAGMLFAFILPLPYCFVALANHAIVYQARRRLLRLLEQRAHEPARALVRELSIFYRPSTPGRARLEILEAAIYGRERRHDEARRILESIDRGVLGAIEEAVLLNDLASSLAMLNEGERAVELARESIERLVKSTERRPALDTLRTCQLGTLGGALVVAGQHQEALPVLEQAIARGGSAEHLSSRHFYVGEALDALGREEGARAAWERSKLAAPDSELGERAAERLEPKSAYRGERPR